MIKKKEEIEKLEIDNFTNINNQNKNISSQICELNDNIKIKDNKILELEKKNKEINDSIDNINEKNKKELELQKKNEELQKKDEELNMLKKR